MTHCRYHCRHCGSHFTSLVPTITEKCRSMTIETCRSEATLRALADLS
jgi:transposase-like protein